MKKTSLLLALLLFAGGLFAQDLPADPNVRAGTLANGLKYYIRHNEKPEKKVELRLAVNAGSILEDDDQQGLAHFMEHMNFNGTKNFPKNKLVDYLQSIGVRFGNDLNAYTSFDETVYMLPIPLDKPENLDTGLKVIEDWAFNATLGNEEIDKERGVVLEELRMGLGAQQRIRDKILPVLLKGSRYAERLPIGKKEILENFKPETLKRFYKDWYRPDLMAVIVVGDINVDEIEKRIQRDFGKYQNPANERQRTVYDVPDHAETLIAEAQDKEMPQSVISVDYNEAGRRKAVSTAADYNSDIVDNLLFAVINNRLQELAQSANPPFTYGWVGKDNIVRTKEGFSAGALTGEGKQLAAMKTLLTEIERAKLGVSQSELDRAKTDVLSSMEKAYNDRDKTESARLVDEYIRNFLEQEPIPGIEWEYNQYKNYLPQISLEQVNAVLDKYLKNENRADTLYGPEKAGIVLPEDSQVLAVFDEVKNSQIEKYDDKIAIEQLVKPFDKTGKITKTETDQKLGTTTWTLNNGAKVIFKKTDFKNDEIVFQAERKGGNSLLPDADFVKTQWAYSLLDEAGLNGYTKTDLQKYLAGKQVSVNPFVGNTLEGLGGQSTPKDLPTLFELVYAYFTGLNYDQTAYQSAIDRQSAIYNNLLSQPNYYYMSELQKFRQKNNPRFTGIIPLAEDWKKTDFKAAYDFYKQKFANAGDFEFFFIGNIDENQLKDLSLKYLANLPSNKTVETFKDNGYRPVYTAPDQVYKKGMDPKSRIQIIYAGDLPKYDETEAQAFEALKEVIDIKMTEVLREDMGGVYSAGTNGGMNKVPYANYSLTLVIPCGPENVDKLTKGALSIIQNIIDKGPEQKDVDKFKEETLNELRDNLKKNSVWLDYLTDYHLMGGDKYKILNEETAVKNVTAKQIQEVAKKYLTPNHRLIATLMPEDGWEKNLKKAEAPIVGGAVVADVSAQSVIDGYIKALGGKEKLDAVKTLYAKGFMGTAGMTFQTVTKKMTPNKFYSEIDMMGQKMLTVFDGTKGYASQMGQKADLPAAQLDEVKSQAAMFDAYALDASKMKPVELQTIGGKDCYVLTDDKGVKRWFDKATGLLYKEEAQTPQGTATQTVTEWKDFDGIKFPTAMDISAGGQNMVVKTESVEINKNVSDADFQ